MKIALPSFDEAEAKSRQNDPGALHMLIAEHEPRNDQEASDFRTWLEQALSAAWIAGSRGEPFVP